MAYGDSWEEQVDATLALTRGVQREPARSREDIALARAPGRPVAAPNQEAIARTDREIENAVADAAKPHAQADHLGALMGEMDWRSEKARLQGEPVMKLELGPKVDAGGFGY